MKTKTIYTILLAAVLSVACSLSANAQITYSGGRLSVDTTPESSYKVTVAGNGAYFKMHSKANFFQIDISSNNTRLAGHGDEIVFYNSATNKYNSIRVQNVFYQSDARAKTNIQNFNGGLAVISQLRPVTYLFIDEGSRASKDEIGLLAQELEGILPDAVMTDENGGKLDKLQRADPCAD